MLSHLGTPSVDHGSKWGGLSPFGKFETWDVILAGYGVGVGIPSVGVAELNVVMTKRKFPTLARQENGRRGWVQLGMQARERTGL